MSELGGKPAGRSSQGDRAPSLPSLPVRVGQLVFSPTRLFDALRERPVWFWTLALGAILVVSGVLAIPTEVWGEMMRAQLLEAGQPVPEGIENQGGLFRVGGAIAAGVFWFVVAFVSAGLITGIFAFLLGDEVGYRQVLSVVSHTSLIGALGSLIVLPLRILQRDPQLTLSVGTFLPGLDGYAGAFFRGLDLFGIWSYLLLALALTRLDPRRGFGVAAAVLMTMFVGVVAVFAIFQA
ncbi:MAG: YIP1 family protein [Gemmatimonadetes bacterium]|nr:YIP1 family protein [Gemmatimonadota bacterium]MBT8403555.1 YIP1 family protein [Gemmatimonadota bacterium]NNK64033.1 hypothetical protein [Gemmatimonadota bacterium]